MDIKCCEREKCMRDIEGEGIICKGCGRLLCEDCFVKCEVCKEIYCKDCLVTKEDADYQVCLRCLETLLEFKDRQKKLKAVDKLAEKAVRTGNLGDLHEYLQARRAI